MSTLKGKEIVDSGWKSAGIFDVLELGSSKMPSINPFQDIDPMLNNDVEQSDDSHLLAVSNVKAEKFEETGFKKVTTTPTLNRKRQRITFP